MQSHKSCGTVWLLCAESCCCVLLQVPVMQHALAVAQQDTFPGEPNLVHSLRCAHTCRMPKTCDAMRQLQQNMLQANKLWCTAASGMAATSGVALSACKCLPNVARQPG
jgi:hypothetical protein